MNNFNKKNWQRIKFGDIAKEVRVAEHEPLKNGLDRYVGLEHIESENLHIKSWGDIADGTTFTRKFVKGQVLFGRRRAYLKKAALADFDGICSGDILVFDAVKGKLIPELLPFIVQNDKFFQYAVDASAGSLSPRVKFKDLSKFELMLPKSLAEQKKLADLLWAGDEVIEEYYQVKNSLIQLKNTLITNMTQASDSKIKLKELIGLDYGKPLKASDRSRSGYPVVGSSGITGYHKYFKNTGPGIVVGRKGGAGQVTWMDENHWVIDTAFSVENKSDLPLKYIYYLLISLRLENLIISTAVPGINRDDVLLLSVSRVKNKEVDSFLHKMNIIEKTLLDIDNVIQKQKLLISSINRQIFSNV